MTSKLKKLACVDDNAINRMLLEHALVDIGGFEVSTYESASSLLASSQLDDPDLFLLDVMMPETDGITLARQLHSRAETRRTPIIFVTARSESLEPDEPELPMYIGVIEKPFDVETLGSKVTEIWNEYTQRMRSVAIG